jgi:hypothetical protein
MITENQYNDLLNELYDQGVENPEDFILEMSENDLIDLLEKFVPLTPDKEGRVLRKLSNLSAEAKGNLSRARELNKKPFSRIRPGVQKEIQKRVNRGQVITKLGKRAADALTKTNQDKIKDSEEREKVIRKKIDLMEPKNNIVRFREEAEFLINYLMNEGFCENENSAEKIVSVMSEEWKNEIFLNEGILGLLKKPTPEQKAAADKRRAEKVIKQKQAALDGLMRIKHLPAHKSNTARIERE